MFKVHWLYTVFTTFVCVLVGLSYWFYQHNLIQKNPDLTIVSRVLSNKEFNSNFRGFNYFQNRNVRNKYRAIKIDINNQTNKEYLLEKDGVGLQLENPLKISRKLKTNFAFAPLVAGLASGALFVLTLGLAVIPSVVAASTIAASTNFIPVEKGNNNVVSSISSRSHDLIHGVLVPAKGMVSRMFFIKKENFKNFFDLKLFELHNKNYLKFFIECK